MENTTDSELVEQTVELTMQLAEITQPTVTPLLPTSLNVTNEVLTVVLNVLEEVEDGSQTQANEVCITF